MNNKQADSDEDRHSSDRYTEDFESDDGKRTSTPKKLSGPKKVSNHQYYQDKFRGRGRHSGTLKNHNQTRVLKRGRGNNNSRSSEPADIRKSHDNVTSRVLSASRNRINELRNKVEELNIQLRELQLENRLYKKMQFRQEKAIRGFEDKESDLPSILDRHNNEVRALREQNRRLKEKYEKSDRYLRDAEDELEKMKMKLKKYKDMCEHQELQERQELSSKLAQAQLDLEEKEVKLKELQRYADMLKKNHRHELGIEVARQKEMKKQVEELTEKNSHLENQLKEKEKALDYLNIYSNPQGRPSRDSSPDGSTLGLKSKKKTLAMPELTPREKAKFYSEKRRLELLKQKELKEEKERKKKEQWQIEEREKEKNIVSNSSQQFVFGNKDKIFDESEEIRLEEEKRHRQDRENRERQDEELMKKQREFEKRQEQDNLDRVTRETRDMKERDKRELHERESKRQEERLRREQKEREEEARMEVEKSKQQEIERRQEEERKIERERWEMLEEERRKKEKIEQEKQMQIEKEKLENDPVWQAERKKKDELLKKIQQVSDHGNIDTGPFSPTSSKKNKDFFFAEIKDTPTSQDRRRDSKEYLFTQPVNNLHKGKPAHEDVTVPYLERQKQRRRTSNDSGGYEPSFGPARGEVNRAHKTKPAGTFDDDEPIFKLPANTSSSSSTKPQDKKSTNLLETLFASQTNKPDKTSTNSVNEKDQLLSRNASNYSSNKIKAADVKNSPYHHSSHLNKPRPDIDKTSTIFGGGALIEDEFLSNNSKVLPRRHRESNLNAFSAKPSVTAIDTFEDEIEEFVL